MHLHNVPWEVLLYWIVKLLKIFGILPGALAVFAVRKFYQKQRQKRAVEGWPATEATIQSGTVHTEGRWRYWAEITYSYFVGEYRSGTYVRHFRREEEADDFIRRVKDKRLQIHYKESNPDNSVILDRDMEMLALLTPEFS